MTAQGLTDADRADQLYADRRRRFNGLLDGYECRTGDWTICGGPALTREEAMRALPESRVDENDRHTKPGRWAVVMHSENGHGYFVINVEQRGAIESVAADASTDNWQPVCFYDLDTLAGDEPGFSIGDKAEYDGKHYVVVMTSDDTGVGIPYETVDLALTEDGEPEHVDLDEQRVTLIERGPDFEDHRNPVRYMLAGIKVVVMFNSTPAAA